MQADDLNWIGFSDWVGGAEKSHLLRTPLREALAVSKFDYFDSNTVLVSANGGSIYLSANKHIKFCAKMAAHIKDGCAYIAFKKKIEFKKALKSEAFTQVYFTYPLMLNNLFWSAFH